MKNVKSMKNIKRYTTSVESQELSDATSSWQPCLDSGKDYANIQTKEGAMQALSWYSHLLSTEDST